MIRLAVSDRYDRKLAAGALVADHFVSIRAGRVNGCAFGTHGLAGSGTRTLQRVTIAEFGYAAQYPADVSIYDQLGNDAMLETA